MIWVQRKAAISRSFDASRTSASQTWVVRPPCSRLATQTTSPSRTVPVKLHLTSAVVKPLAPSGQAVETP